VSDHQDGQRAEQNPAGHQQRARLQPAAQALKCDHQREQRAEPEGGTGRDGAAISGNLQEEPAEEEHRLEHLAVHTARKVSPRMTAALPAAMVFVERKETSRLAESDASSQWLA